MTVRPSLSGFADPVLNAQAVFRAVMSALARPGTIHNLPAKLAPPEPLTPDLAAVALALADHETSVWLGKGLARSPQVAEFLRFHTGGELTKNAHDAAFALADSGEGLPPLSEFAQGSDEYPDRSTTLVLAVASLTGGAELFIDGPGIKKQARLCIDPMPPGFVEQFAENRTRFPRGVDCIFVANGKVAALPRTTRVTEA